MKKISIILNAVMIIAIAVLYVLHFLNQSKVEEKKPVILSEDNLTPAEIVYVNLDTLLNNLDMYIDETASLQAKFNQSKKDFDNRASKFQKDVNDLQEKAQKQLITTSNFRKKQEELGLEEQYLRKMEQDLTLKFSEEQEVMLRRIMFEITKYINKYNADNNYKFVINNSFGGALLYGKESLNITNDIIDGMNAEYAKEEK